MPEIPKTVVKRCVQRRRRCYRREDGNFETPLGIHSTLVASDDFLATTGDIEIRTERDREKSQSYIKLRYKL